MEIYLIRHGESKSNISDFLKDDDLDSSLTLKGINQIKKLKKKLEFHGNILVFSSPLKRAIETSKIIFPNKNTHIIDEFREFNKGFSKSKFKNFTWMDWNKYFLYNKKQIESYDWKYPYGESLNDFKKRIIPVFIKIIESNKDIDKIFIISHNWVIKILIGYILSCEIGYLNLKIENASYIKIKYLNGDFSIII